MRARVVSEALEVPDSFSEHFLAGSLHTDLLGLRARTDGQVYYLSLVLLEEVEQSFLGNGGLLALETLQEGRRGRLARL